MPRPLRGLSVTAFLLVLFLAPPTRLLTGWTEVVRDERPALRAAGLLVAFLVVLLTAVTALTSPCCAPAAPRSRS